VKFYLVALLVHCVIAAIRGFVSGCGGWRATIGLLTGK
jgi:hypothetical protein